MNQQQFQRGSKKKSSKLIRQRTSKQTQLISDHKLETHVTEEDVQNNKQQQPLKTKKQELDQSEIESIVTQGKKSYFFTLLVLIFLIYLYLEHRIEDAFQVIDSVKYLQGAGADNILDITQVRSEFLTQMLSNIYGNKQFQKDYTLATEETDMTFINIFNYYLGTQVSVNKFSFEESDQNLYENFYFQLSQDTSIQDTTLKLDGEGNIIKENSNTNTLFPEYVKQEDNEIVFFYPSSFSQNDAMAFTTSLENELDSRFVGEIQIKLYLLNPIKEIVVRQVSIFEQTQNGVIKFKSEVDYFTFINTEGPASGIIQISYYLKIIMMIVLVYQMIIDSGHKVFKMIMQFITTMVFEFDIDLIVQLSLRIFMITYLINWFILFGQFSDLKLKPFDSLDDIQLYEEFFTLYKQVRILGIITLGFIIILLISLINQFFPGFGMLFKTFEKSFKDVSLLLIFLLILFIGFIICINILFFGTDSELSSFGSCLTTCLEFLFQISKVQFLTNKAGNLGFVLAVIFTIIFNFIMIPYFFSIIIVIYNQLRLQNQSTIEAIARLATEKAEEFKQKFINLISLAEPEQDEEEEEEEEQYQQNQQKNNNNNLNYDRKKSTLIIQTQDMEKQPFLSKNNNNGNQENFENQGQEDIEEQKQQKKKQKKSYTIGYIIQYNLDQFGISTDSAKAYILGESRSGLETQQQYLQQVEQKKIELQIQKQTEKRNIINKRKKTVFTNFYNSITHFIFIMIFFFMTQYQIQTQNIYACEKSLKEHFTDTKTEIFSSNILQEISLEEISNIEHLQFYIKQIYLPSLTRYPETRLYEPRLDNFFEPVGSQPGRITIRVYETTESEIEDQFGQKIIIKQRDPDQMDIDSVFSTQIDFQINGQTTDINYRYQQPGSYGSSNQVGGFAKLFTSNFEENIYIFQNFVDDKLINFDTGILVLDTIFYNRFYDIFTYLSIYFQIQSSGKIEINMRSSSFITSLYSGNKGYRIILEVIFLFYFIYNWYKLLVDWYKCFNQEECMQITPYQEKLADNPIQYYLNIQVVFDENFNPILFTFNLLKRLSQFLFRFLLSINLYISESQANLLAFFGQLISTYTVLLWILYLINTDRLNYEVEDGEIQHMKMFETFSEIFSNYVFYTSILGFLQILRILFYFGFSAQLTLVLDVVSNAQVDIILFLVMFLIIMFAFSVIGVVVFGFQNKNLQNIVNTFLTQIKFLSGMKGFPKINAYISSTELIFYVVFMILMYLILMRMFIAILDAHYIEIKKEQGDMHSQGIIDVIKEKIRRISEQEQAKEKIRIDKLEKKQRRLSRRLSKMSQQSMDITGNNNQNQINYSESKKKPLYIKCKLYFIEKIYNAFSLQKDIQQQENEKQKQQILVQNRIKLNIFENNNDQIQPGNRFGEIDHYFYAQEKEGEIHKKNQHQIDKMLVDKTALSIWLKQLKEKVYIQTNHRVDFQSFWSVKLGIKDDQDEMAINKFGQREKVKSRWVKILENMSQNQQLYQESKEYHKNLLANSVNIAKGQINKKISDQNNLDKFIKVQPQILKDYLKNNNDLKILQICLNTLVKFNLKLNETKEKYKTIQDYQNYINIFDILLAFFVFLAIGPTKLQDIYNKENEEKTYISMTNIQEIVNELDYNYNYLQEQVQQEDPQSVNILGQSMQKNKRLSKKIDPFVVSQMNIQSNQMINSSKSSNSGHENEIESEKKPKQLNKFLQNVQKDININSNQQLKQQKNNQKQNPKVERKRQGIVMQKFQNQDGSNALPSLGIYGQKEMDQDKQNYGFIGYSGYSSDKKIPVDIIPYLTEQEYIQIFLKINFIQDIWKNLSLNDQLLLWFGDYESKFYPQKSPKLQRYHKVILWEQMGYHKQYIVNFDKMTNIDNKNNNNKRKQSTDQNIEEKNDYIGQDQLNQMWIQLSQEIDISENQNEYYNYLKDIYNSNKFTEAYKHQIKHKLSKSQLKLIQQIVRGPKNHIHYINKLNSFKQKVSYIKRHFQTNDKMIFWHLMSYEEKQEIINFQANPISTQIYNLFIIEEFYDRIMTMQKFEKETNKKHQYEIYNLYSSYAQYNGFSSAWRQQQANKPTSQDYDIMEYIKFLEDQLKSTGKEVLQVAKDLKAKYKKIVEDNQIAHHKQLHGNKNQQQYYKQLNSPYDSSYNTTNQNSKQQSQKHSLKKQTETKHKKQKSEGQAIKTGILKNSSHTQL